MGLSLNAGALVSLAGAPADESYGNAMIQARDALETALDFYFDDRREVPAPSEARRGERLIELPASLSAKVLLLN